MKPASTKRKGTRLEKWVADQLQALGIKQARRQPGSGVYQGFPHDVAFTLPLVGRMIVECKSWKFGWRVGDKALGAADLLVIKRDRGEPCVYMPWARYAEMVEALHEAEQRLGDMGAAAGSGAVPAAVDGFLALGDRPRDRVGAGDDTAIGAGERGVAHAGGPVT